MNKYRTHNCGELNINNVDQEVRIAGWLQNCRDHGGILFLDIRDHYGVTQVVVNSDEKSLMEISESTPKESTVSILGIVRKRTDDTINDKLKTGYIEIVAKEINVISKAVEKLPFEIYPDKDVKEDLRLKYRFLDLRRESVHNNMILRSEIIRFVRDEMYNLGFMEMQTPILTSSSPEGARDFLVPSRLHHGKFYALPQAPQQFKQLLMTSGFDKYFQVAPCFRDEDARAFRSPGEFYQLDVEMAFATQEDVFETMENILPKVFKKFSDWKINSDKFPRITYNDSMEKYGSDKPDLRNPLIIENITELFNNVEFKAFSGKTVKVICVDNCAKEPRSFFDSMIDFAIENGAPGLAWLKVNEDLTHNGPIAKFIDEETQIKISKQINASADSVIFFIADEPKKAIKLSGIIRTELANRLDLIEKDIFKFCWIIDFPMYEYDEENEKIEFSHNPFSMPQGGMESLLNKNPLDIYAYQYDIVCNGVELSSGAVRNHDPEIMIKAFEIAGYNEDTIKDKFPALFNAFHFGAPPHAGIAPGLDVIIMLIANTPNIREITLFPMNTKAQDLLTCAPNTVSEKQLREVHIKIRE